MTAAAFVRVAHRNALDVGLPQEIDHHAQALRADADEGNIDLRAGRNLTRAAQHMSRHDSEGSSRRTRRAEKLAPRHDRLRLSNDEWRLHCFHASYHARRTGR